jgi:hypothetical protein
MTNRGRAWVRLSVAMVACLAIACEAPTRTAVLLDVKTEEARRPYFLSLDWFGPGGVLIRGLRVPSVDILPVSGPQLARVFIEGGELPTGPRRALLKSEWDGVQFWVAARIDQEEGRWVEVPLFLQSEGFVDSDGDGVPDPIDDCPGANDYLGCPR